MKQLLFFLAIILGFTAFSQEKFSEEILTKPKKNGDSLRAQFEEIEIEQFFADSTKPYICVRNGLRSSSYVNPENWEAVKDTMDPLMIDIVFSKYPIRENGYVMQIPLLQNRIKKLIAIDPQLNRDDIKWRIVLQTNCTSDEQVDSMFHGVVIWYEEYPPKPEVSVEEIKQLVGNDSIQEESTIQGSLSETEKVINTIQEAGVLTDSVIDLMKDKSVKEKQEIMVHYLEEKLENTEKKDVKTMSDKEVDRVNKKLKKFEKIHPNTDPVVIEVLDRHIAKWEDIIVVNDWTGSMYPYGNQVLQWHMAHLDSSQIQSLTLFNDGDSNRKKEIGSTGGIYTESVDNVNRLINLFYLVMGKGDGGDFPENDIEAVLAAIEDTSTFQEVILIADNNATVRDIELASMVDVPIRIILCGYDSLKGIRPEYYYLAQRTGGSIHTIDNDYYEIKESKQDEDGYVTMNDGERFKIMDGMFVSTGYLLIGDTSTCTNIKEVGYFERPNIRSVDLSEQNLKRIPNKVYKLTFVKELDLSDNNLKEVSKKIRKMQGLNSLDLSNNQLSELPIEMKELKYLKKVDLSGNNISELSHPMIGCLYLEELYLEENNISKINTRLGFRRLKILDLSHNELSRIPKSVYRLKKLEKLDLSGNGIKSISSSIYKLRNLKYLDLSDNELTKLPESIAKMTNLRVLKLTGNNFSDAEKKRIQEMLPNCMIEF